MRTRNVHGTWKLWCREAYDTVIITSRWDVSIRHDCYHPLQMQTRDFSRNLITTMMWGIRHGRYYLKIGWEHTARPQSHTTEMQTRDFFGNLITVMMIGVRHDLYYLKMGCKHKARPLSPITNLNIRDFSGNLITTTMRGIQHCRYYLKIECDICHGRCHPLKMRIPIFLGTW